MSLRRPQPSSAFSPPAISFPGLRIGARRNSPGRLYSISRGHVKKSCCFLPFLPPACSRMPWRRCLTPEGRSLAARREHTPDRKVRNSRFLKRSAGERIQPASAPSPQAAYRSQARARTRQLDEPGGRAGIRRAGQERIGGSCLEKRVYMRRTVVV